MGSIFRNPRAKPATPRVDAPQSFPSPSYKWGVGRTTSSQNVKVEHWWKTRKAAIQAGRAAFLRNPVLVRWHADDERMSLS